MKMLLMSVMALVAFCASGQPMRKGDLMFHFPARDNSITEVSPARIDHVAIYLGGDSVLEAVPDKGVTVTKMGQLLKREDGCYYYASVKGADRKQSILNARKYIGMPYDSLFLPGNEAVYCSELVQCSYVDRKGTLLFGTVPMSFRNSRGLIDLFWVEFYSRHGMSVPEGEQGSNPAELSRRSHVGKLRPLKSSTRF